MTQAFCPGHISCFFQPVSSYDLLSAGSRGVGIRLSMGSTVTLEERSDQKIEIIMDDEHVEGEITRSVLRMISPERGFDVTIENSLPVSQGFGMSAAGAIAAGLCACKIAGKNKQEAFRAAHLAEIEGGGGLGDVAALASPHHIPVRMTAGLPPLGSVVEGGPQLSLTLVTIGAEMRTDLVLKDPEIKKKISSAGSKALDGYMKNPTVNNLFKMSRMFSSAVGLETPKVANTLQELGRNAGMCMLGNSIFTTLPPGRVAEITDENVIRCTSTDRLPKITRKG